MEPGARRPITMRGQAEAAAALVNAVLVLVVPLAFVWLEHARLGATIDALRLARSASILLPFAAFAAWRTWVHAKRWRAQQDTWWHPVAEAAATAVVVACVYLARGILARPAEAPAYVVVYAGSALILGAIVGGILRTTALLALTLHGWMFVDDSDRGRG